MTDVVLQAALGVCPKEKPFLDPFQFNFIMQVHARASRHHFRS
jgi:hypothetical protein